MRCLVGSLLAVLALAPLGCGQKTASVTGTVKSTGKTLPLGHITFVAANGKVITGPINDGTYSLADVPVGLAKIAVKSFAPGHKVTSPVEAIDGGKTSSDPKPAKPAAFMRVEAHYGDPEQSKLTYMVEAGPQTYDIDLK